MVGFINVLNPKLRIMEKDNVVYVPCTIVAVQPIKTFSAEGKDVKYASVHATIGTTLLKFKVMPEENIISALEKVMFKQVKLECQIFAGQGLVAGLRVSGVVGSK